MIPILFRSHSRSSTSVAKLFAFMGPTLSTFFRAGAQADPHQWGHISCLLFIYHRASRSSCERACWLEVFASIFFMLFGLAWFVLGLNKYRSTHIPPYMTPIHNSIFTTVPSLQQYHTATTLPSIQYSTFTDQLL